MLTKRSFLAVGLAVIVVLLLPTASAPSRAQGRESTSSLPSDLFFSTDPRDHCSKYYPVPDGSDSWTTCEDKGRSGCGGPEQCICGANERLVTYQCVEGTFHKCVEDPGCGKR